MKPRLVTVPFLLAWPPRRFIAQTWGPFILVNAPLADDLTVEDVAHELVHVEQWVRLQWLFPIKYLYEMLTENYRGNDLEEEAVAKAHDPWRLAFAAQLIEEWKRE